MAIKNYPGDFWERGGLVKQYEIDRLADDGCPHHDREDDAVAGVRRMRPVSDPDYFDFGDGMSRIYICQGHDQCKRFCWHPVSYCFGCGAKMVMIKGYRKNLDEFIRRNGYKDSGY